MSAPQRTDPLDRVFPPEQCDFALGDADVARHQESAAACPELSGWTPRDPWENCR